MGYRLTAAEGEASVALTDPEWRALIYVASRHGFSAPHLRLEDGEEEALEVEAADAEGLRGALGEALEARDTEVVRTPDGELAYDTIQRVRHVLLSSEGVRLARTPRPCSPECVESLFCALRLYGVLRCSSWQT